MTPQPVPDNSVLNLDERVKTAMLALLEGVEKEDQYLYLTQLKQFKKNNLFWHGFQYIFWSDVDNDWRVPTDKDLEEISAREETRYIFDYVLNQFKAHGESIIAALSADIPDVRFGPRDADDPDDRRAVQAADNAAELIEKWNRAKSCIIEALFLLSTEGFVASYTYHKKDPDYGTANIPSYEMQDQKTVPDSKVCPSCGYSEDESQEGAQPPQEEANEPCPQCGQPMQYQEGLTESVPLETGSKIVPKGREVIEIYGPCQVRVAPFVMKLADSGFLIQYVDNDVAMFQGTFKEVADDIRTAGGDQNYERLMRQSSLSMEGYQLTAKLTTLKRGWFRPWMLNRLGDSLDDDVRAWFDTNFKTGIYFSAINGVICEYRDEAMDKHWSITKAGPSKGVHADPLLQSIVSPQELHNNLVNLFAMQVEYGVPASYADAEVFDFKGQSRQEVAPGYIYPVTRQPGESISNAFFTERTATLSKEATQLLQTIETSEQFLVGDFPSIHGGPSVSGSKTLGEYEKSRAFALQRLSLVWYFINVWWSETLHKSVLSFIDHQIEDEPLTKSSTSGFMTVWIKKADMKGSFERLEPEASSDFPVSFSQKRGIVTSLLQLNNEEINSVLFSPENAGVTQRFIGLPEFKLPMETQRQKQMREILILIGLEPQDLGNGQFQAPVPVEPEIDEHGIHVEVCVQFLASDTGQDLKENNPQGYASVMTHLLEHKQAMAMAAMGGMPPPGPGAPPMPGPGGPPQLPKVGAPQGA